TSVSWAATHWAHSASPLVVSRSPVLVVSNRISLLTTSTTSSTGVSVGTVTVIFPTIVTGAAARRLRLGAPANRAASTSGRIVAGQGWVGAGQSDSLSCQI